MEAIKLDGIAYRVKIEFGSLVLSFAISEGKNSGTSLTNRLIRDILGTSYEYAMKIEPDVRYPDDFDAFFDAISAPVNSHMVEMPYGQDYLIFEAAVTGGSMTYDGILAGRKRWTALEVRFSPIEPQRRQ